MVRFAATALALLATLQGSSAYCAELVLLDFWSPTCGPCMKMKPTVEAFISANYPIRQIDVSREHAVAQQYRVTGVPCFVMLLDGQEVDRVVGATSSERLQLMFTRAKEMVASRPPRVNGQSPDVRAATPAPAQQPAWDGVGDAQATAQSRGPATSENSVVPIEGGDNWPEQFNNRLLTTSVRIRVEDDKGQSHGTGTIIDARSGEALIITCGHLFRESQGKGPLTVELFEAGQQGLKSVERVAGQVISYDLKRDVALVTIRPTHPVCVACVAPQRTAIDRGDRTASVGCSHGQDPTVMPSRITRLDPYKDLPAIETNVAPVIGRSGGGLFNEQGQLIGVCFGADYEGNKGVYAGLESVHDELNRLGLSDIYMKSSSAATDSMAAAEQQAPEMIVRGQVDDAQPPAAVNPGAETQGPAEVPASLSATEHAALEEIMSRAATHEVVCIIRPKEAGGQSEVITLDNVSPEFVKALASRRQAAQSAGTR